MESFYREFNNTLRQLFTTFKDMPSKGFKAKLHIDALRDKMNAGISAEPSYAITVFGPYLWNQRERIRGAESKWFLEHDYAHEVMKLSRVHKFNYDDATNAIGHMKEAYRGAAPAKQAEIAAAVQNLLVTYAKYLQGCKQVC